MHVHGGAAGQKAPLLRPVLDQLQLQPFRAVRPVQAMDIRADLPIPVLQFLLLAEGEEELALLYRVSHFLSPFVMKFARRPAGAPFVPR